MDTNLKEHNEIMKDYVMMVPAVDMKTVQEFLTKEHEEMTEKTFSLLVNQMVENKLNPYKRECYVLPFNDKRTGKKSFQLVTSYTVYLARANYTGLLDGWNVEIHKDDKGNVTGGEIVIHRKDWSSPFQYSVDFNEVKQDNTIWKKKPSFMTKKVLIGQGMRMCFPEFLSGMPYEQDELPQSGFQGEVIEGDRQEEKKASLPDVSSIEQPKPVGISDAQMKFIGVLYKKCGSLEDEFRDHLKQEYEVGSRKDLTKKQATELIGTMLHVIERKFTKGEIELTKEEIEDLFKGESNKKTREGLLDQL